VVIAERWLLRPRDAERSSRSFLFSRLPHFVFISCAHQTIFLKKIKTHGDVFRGKGLKAGASDLKNRILSLKTAKLMSRQRKKIGASKRKNINIHRMNIVSERIFEGK
jgi:hypothetical protein